MRQIEITHANFFLDWLNSKRDLDFIVDSTHKGEDTHIDVLAVSEKLGKKISIQSVAFRGEGLVYSSNMTVSGNPELIKLLPKFKAVLVPTQYDKKKSIEEYINKKERKYPENLVTNLVLLIEATVPSTNPDELANYFPNGLETKFMGVYFIQLPIPMAAVDDKWAHTGFVFPVKEIQF
jgi:hypothetical protein